MMSDSTKPQSNAPNRCEVQDANIGRLVIVVLTANIYASTLLPATCSV